MTPDELAVAGLLAPLTAFCSLSSAIFFGLETVIRL
jgi:hypothetical protein